jgi:hypothetical protein
VHLNSQRDSYFFTEYCIQASESRDSEVFVCFMKLIKKNKGYIRQNKYEVNLLIGGIT